MRPPRPCLFALLLVVCIGTQRMTNAKVVQVYNLPPVSSNHEAGYLHGQKAKSRIRAFLSTTEISRVINFTNTAHGMDVLSALKKHAALFSPWLEKEVAGIAQGAETSVNNIWAVNLLSELEAVMPSGQVLVSELEKSDGHCSDVFARSGNGEVWHGHNEDWSLEFRPLLYVVVYNSLDAKTFPPVGGLVYPGQTPGFAITFTPTLWTTQNSLFPKGLNSNGKCVVATMREALVAAGNSRNIDPLTRRLAAPGQAYGMSINGVARKGRGAHARKFPMPHQLATAFNVEVAGALNRSRVTTLASLGSNMTHFNNYKFMHDIPVLNVRCLNAVL